MSDPKGFLFPFPDGDCSIGRKFMEDPDGFLKARGMTYSDIQCPQEAHDAIQRAIAFRDDAEKLGPVQDADDVKELEGVVQRHFGSDYGVEYMPFGLRFKECIAIDPQMDSTATATGSVTWLDGDVDTDS